MDRENSQTQLMVEMRIRKRRLGFFACEMDKRQDASRFLQGRLKDKIEGKG